MPLFISLVSLDFVIASLGLVIYFISHIPLLLMLLDTCLLNYTLIPTQFYHIFNSSTSTLPQIFNFIITNAYFAIIHFFNPLSLIDQVQSINYPNPSVLCQAHYVRSITLGSSPLVT